MSLVTVFSFSDILGCHVDSKKRENAFSVPVALQDIFPWISFVLDSFHSTNKYVKKFRLSGAVREFTDRSVISHRQVDRQGTNKSHPHLGVVKRVKYAMGISISWL